MSMKNCIFCQIVDKQSPANILFENADCIAFTPLDPVAKGHVLIVPKAHYRDIFDIDPGILSAVVVFSKQVARDIVNTNKATGVNILHASGADAQQSVFHFHIHVVPRYSNDGLDLWPRNKL